MKTYIDRGDVITYNRLSIPKTEENRDYKLFLKELREGLAELIPYEEPVPTYIDLRNNAYLLSMGGSSVEAHLEYSYVNGYKAWRDELTRVRRLYPNPDGDDTTTDTYTY